MNLEGITLGEVSQTENKYVITYMQNLTNKIRQINEYNKTETDSQIHRTNQWLPLGMKKKKKEEGA